MGIKSITERRFMYKLIRSERKQSRSNHSLIWAILMTAKIGVSLSELDLVRKCISIKRNVNNFQSMAVYENVKKADER